MQKKSLAKPVILLTFLGASCALLSGFIFGDSEKEKEQKKISTNSELRSEISAGIGQEIQNNQFPVKHALILAGKKFEANIKYTIDPVLQKEAVHLLESYKPDYGSIVLMDAKTGRILAMKSFQKDDRNASNWALQATFPAASIFKVITATAALDKGGLGPEHRINYNGGAYTLYKKNVLSEQVNRWTHSITIKDAFARSINTAFARLSIENLEPIDLQNYAEKFMFNQPIPTDFPVQMGIAYVPPEKGFALAEVASGYNKTNKMSPVQGAMIAASVANDGHMTVPYLVDSIKNNDGEIIYSSTSFGKGQIMAAGSAEDVRKLMGQTVISGTSRKTFRQITRDRKFKEVEMGGKTGHLTGENPAGRVDWFIGYAMDSDDKIAVAAVTVSKKYWTVKSGHLGQSMFRKFFSSRPIELDTNSNLKPEASAATK